MTEIEKTIDRYVRELKEKEKRFADEVSLTEKLQLRLTEAERLLHRLIEDDCWGGIEGCEEHGYDRPRPYAKVQKFLKEVADVR